MVLLKALFLIKTPSETNYLHSNMVLLKANGGFIINNIFKKFTFQYGTT